MAEKIEGGALGGADDLYREVILEHFKSPKNKGRVDHANAESEGVNPLCGDQLTITALVENDSVKEVKFEGHGCAISQSAASMMTSVIQGKSVSDIRELAKAYKEIFGIEKEGEKSKFSIEDLGDTVALEGVRKYPVRIKCALLSWNTLMQGLESLKK